MAKGAGSFGSSTVKKVAASKVYKLVRKDIRTFLGSNPPPRTPVRLLRSELWDEIALLCERWYRRGCRRGFMETRDHFKSTGKMPKHLRYEYMTKEFFHKRARTGTVTKK
ncbi:MAG: hypothetical protein EPO55_20210 [Reyranella sp.]|uniref:hypothetical protein n=1 Tax=Reyranella sp. TaxID=1929291 RepID=UPI00121E968C|nr:hypothetical protein [Reyranella sp.]TAJ36851.1 MAG: hypothetical protein EPO55_20210 [Reyranella sp.]